MDARHGKEHAPTMKHVVVNEPSDLLALRGDCTAESSDPVIAAALLRDCRLGAETESNGRVAAIVPNYNNASLIVETLESLLAQSRRPDEIIVVDDASTDDSVQVVIEWGEKHASDEVAIGLIQNTVNSGNVGGPRNRGINATDAEFIMCLDSDDMVEPAYVNTLLTALQADDALGVAYAGVQVLDQQTGQRHPWDGWPPPFNWDWATARRTADGEHKWINNCIPTASLFRRGMWLRSGGYDAGRACAEDAEFWVRALGTGYAAAKVSNDPLFVYRRRKGTMSERPIVDMGMWNSCYRGFVPLAAPTGRGPVINDYTQPLVSVIIPVGPTHVDKLPTALHSLLAQTMLRWEVIVVNATGHELPLVSYPFVRTVKAVKETPPGECRNLGVHVAKAPLCFFLDADDAITNDALLLMMSRYSQGDAGYVYCGWWVLESGRVPQGYASPNDYSVEGWLNEALGGLHTVSVLVATDDVKKVGWFDPTLSHYEDWEFFARAARAGLCGARVSDPLLIYRRSPDGRAQQALSHRVEIKNRLEHISRREQMACCGGQSNAVAAAQQATSGFLLDRNTRSLAAPGSKLLKYTGPEQGEIVALGKYIGCVSCEPVLVANGDWQTLLDSGRWVELTNEVPYMPELPVVGDDDDAS